MNMYISIAIFVVLNFVNVILGTMRSILTVKASPTIAMLINTISYTFYAGIVKMTTGQPMWIVLVTTAITNIIGVYLAKWIVKKMTKEKLWKVECTFEKYNKTTKDANLIFAARDFANANKIPFNYIDIDKYVIVNFFCSTQKQSACVKDFIIAHNGKYFVSESKAL